MYVCMCIHCHSHFQISSKQKYQRRNETGNPVAEAMLVNGNDKIILHADSSNLVGQWCTLWYSTHLVWNK